MESNGEIDMEDEVTKFCVSCVTIMAISNALADFVSAWNCLRIPGRNGGIPNMLARATNQVTQLHPTNFPSTDTVVQLYERGSTNRLTRESNFGRDPLYGYSELQRLRQRDLFIQFPNMDMAFQGTLHGYPQLFKDAIGLFITLTRNYSSLVHV